MINEIFSIHYLQNSIEESPDTLKKIFNSCIDYLGGSINVYKIFNNGEQFIIICNIKKDNITNKDKMKFIDTVSNYKKVHFKDYISELKSRTIFIKKNDNKYYEEMEFFYIFPSMDNLSKGFASNFYFNHKKNKFMFIKEDPDYNEDEINTIIRWINFKKDPFIETPENVNSEF